jgi:hypothetical protein
MRSIGRKWMDYFQIDSEKAYDKLVALPSGSFRHGRFFNTVV